MWVGRQGADAQEKVEEGLEDVDDVPEVVVEDEAVVSAATGEEEEDDFVCV